jgi:hypothetical protein
MTRAYYSRAAEEIAARLTGNPDKNPGAAFAVRRAHVEIECYGIR